jgi:dipeptidyl-peptidase-4
MKILSRILIYLLISIQIIESSYSQEFDPSLLTLDRIFNSYEFYPEFYGPVKWLADGSGFTTVEYSSAVPGGQDLVKYDPVTKKTSILISASELIPDGQDIPLEIENYSWSKDGKNMLIFTNTARVWRLNTKGDYWIFDITTRKLKQIGSFADPSMLMFAKFSPDGTRVAYVEKNDIYVEELSNSTVTRLTYDGSKTIINGNFDWVYEEEFIIYDGFRWSPDGKSIAYWQLDASGVREFYMINNTDSLYPRIITIPYPKVGETLSSCRVGVVPVSGGETVWMKTPGDQRNNYIPRMEWAGNSEAIAFQYLNRLQNKNEVMLGNPSTGEVRTVLTETDEAWLDVSLPDGLVPGDIIKWIGGGNYFTWISERSGWRHMYMVSRDGKEIRPVTSGNYDITAVNAIDEKEGFLYFTASPDNPTQRFLYRIKLDGTGKPDLLTPVSSGYHEYNISPDAKWAIHTWSDFETPETVELISLPKHKSVTELADNGRLKDAVKEIKKLPVEFFRVDIGDGVKLDGWMMKPYNFDKSKKYPVLFYVYGEPWGQTVLDQYGSLQYIWYLMLTQQGYIVISIDNRGTPAPRGREWRKCVYNQIGVLAPSEQAKAARIISEWDFIDKGRLAIWGWSGGGSMTLNALLQYPDIYNTGIAVASVPDLALYDAIYQERYMQTLQTNADGYKKGSPITYAENLKGNLLIIHGTGDDNVHYQGMEKLINEFVKYNRQFTMMAYPNRSHGIYEGEGTKMHLYTLMTRYLMDKMSPGGK